MMAVSDPDWRTSPNLCALPAAKRVAAFVLFSLIRRTPSTRSRMAGTTIASAKSASSIQRQ